MNHGIALDEQFGIVAVVQRGVGHLVPLLIIGIGLGLAPFLIEHVLQQGVGLEDELRFVGIFLCQMKHGFVIGEETGGIDVL